MIRLTLVLLLSLLIGLIYAQYPNKSALTLEEIMKGNDFIGHSPTSPFWSLGGDTLYYYQYVEDSPVSEMRYYLPAEDITSVVPRERRGSINPVPYPFNFKSDKYQVVKFNDKVYLSDPKLNSIRILYEDASELRDVQMSTYHDAVLYAQGNDWFAHSIATGSIKRLTKVINNDPPKDKEHPDSWIAKEELELFDYLKEQKEKKEDLKSYREEMKQYDNSLPNLYLGKKNISNLGITRDGRYAFYILSSRSDSKNTEVPEWIRDDGYVQMNRARSKVGQYSEGQDILIWGIETRDSMKFDWSKLTGIYDKPAFMREYHNDSTEYKPQFKERRKVIFQNMVSSKKGKYVVLDIVSVDNKDRWLVRLDLRNNQQDLIVRQHDEAWIGGPGIRGWRGNNTLGFIGDSDLLYYQSESDGFSHLYTYDCSNNSNSQLTQGDYEVKEVHLSKNATHFYTMLNKDDSGIYHWYKFQVDGTGWEQLTFLPGKWDLCWDIQEENFAALYSKDNRPTELYVQLGPGTWHQITRSQSTDFSNYAWREPSYVSFKAADGTQVPARLYQPVDSLDKKSAVIFVHGAGYLQNAHKYWSSYFREYMFHNFLADNGYTVLDIDYRGSAGYGRDWRTAIYRHMGGLDLSDHVDGAKYLVDSLGVRNDKIGIYGGSYGGFITLMAMFNHPEVFACGAALRSVTDWAHYNHGYTSNILNSPETDPNSYRRSSPIYFAEGLDGPLLILHGMVDMNVQFQDVVRLAQRLIELEKNDWEMALYPVEDHGFTETKSWLDEYKRIYKLFYTHLE